MYQSLRPLLFAALLSVSGFTACQKAEVEPVSQPAITLVGRWELTQTAGGIGGGMHPADPAQRQEIEFMANGQAQTLLNGTPTGTAPYSLSQRVSFLTQRPETFLIFASPRMGLSAFIAELSATTLVLSEEGYDGLSTTYRRVQPLFCGTR